MMSPDVEDDASTVCRRLDVSRETQDRLALYVDLLKRWQKRINLVSPTTVRFVWSRHILDSGQLVWHLPPPADPLHHPRLVDLGSGAGFPGMVLAILGVADVILVEADRRKATFLREVLRETGINGEVIQARIENLSPLDAEIVTARALAPLTTLLGLSYPHLKPDGVALLMKGERVREELMEAAETWRFEHQAIPSVTNPKASIVKITALAPIGADRKQRP